MLLMIVCTPPILKKRGLTKTLLIMKFTAILLTVTCLQLGATGLAQNITLSERNVPLQKVFKSIEGQTGYVFFFNYAWLRHARRVNVEARNASLMEALELCFRDQPLTYEIVNKTIVVKPKTTPVTGQPSREPLHGSPIDIRAEQLSGKQEPDLKVVHTVTGSLSIWLKTKVYWSSAMSATRSRRSLSVRETPSTSGWYP